ncbi:glycosyltransferase [Paenibacillus vini]|uniref:glycosyltransferase n=1 Tax=Paenibacillus vini TaxID=1476024 RepID=UPI0025B6FEE4|nr:glycosyltransferase [Paenibacillus vini]MDN4066451.1 glycosyltransferase [Paenibacillus vini]
MDYSVTAVIPVYNAEKFITYTIDSLLNQTYKLNEIIIVDDCSTDSTINIVNEYIRGHECLNIRIMRNLENRGVSYSRNKGIEASTSDWIMFIDADDIAEPALVATMLHRYAEHTSSRTEDFLLIHSAYRQMNEEGIVSKQVTRFMQVEPEEILGYELVRNHVYLSGTIVKRDALIDCGGFDPLIRYCEDWDLWIKLAHFGGFIYVDDPLVRIRRHSNNVSRSIKDILQSEKKVISKYSLEFIEKAIKKRHLPYERNTMDFVNMLYRFDYWNQGFQIILEFMKLNQSYSPSYFFKGLYYIHNNQIKEAAACFKEAIHLNPEDAASLNNLGICLGLIGRQSDAMGCFQRASFLAEGYMDCSYNIGILNGTEKNGLLLEDFKITWRELRPVLLKYEI